MKNMKIVRSKLSEQQYAYLKLIAAEVRSTPGDMLLALAFGGMESDDEDSGVDLIDQWIANLRGFVDERKIPSTDPQRINGYTSGGRIAVEVPHA